MSLSSLSTLVRAYEREMMGGSKDIEVRRFHNFVVAGGMKARQRYLAALQKKQQPPRSSMGDSSSISSGIVAQRRQQIQSTPSLDYSSGENVLGKDFETDGDKTRFYEDADDGSGNPSKFTLIPESDSDDEGFETADED